MISTVLIWLGVILAGVGLYLAYRKQQAQATAWAQATAVAFALEPEAGLVEEIVVEAPTATATATFTPEVFPSGWSTATPMPMPTGDATRRASPVLITRAVSPQPTPTPTPPPEPPERIVITEIELDAAIIPIGWSTVSENGQESIVWQVADDAVSWHKTSAMVGQSGNLVLNGHHNVKGEVFRYLVDLKVGDVATLYAGGKEFHYLVTEKHILREKDEPIEVRRKNAEWIGPTVDQRLTMVTCWPYTNNTHRLVVVARPATAAEVEGLTAE